MYIRYGGTMSLGVVYYNETSTFANKKSADEYADSAIARNIQHSLKCYDNQGHFRHQTELLTVPSTALLRTSPTVSPWRC